MAAETLRELRRIREDAAPGKFVTIQIVHLDVLLDIAEAAEPLSQCLKVYIAADVMDDEEEKRGAQIFVGPCLESLLAALARLDGTGER